MDAPRRDMELLSNSLAAYAHIRGEGGPRGAWAPPCPSEAPLHPFPPHLPARPPHPATARGRLPTLSNKEYCPWPPNFEAGGAPLNGMGSQGSCMTSAL